MFSQLWHTGRSSRIEMTSGQMPVSASVNPSYWEDASHIVSAPSGWIKPSPHRALDIAEIPGIVEDYRRAAERAKAAGLDGVELHAANGYLPDQFLQDGSKQAHRRLMAVPSASNGGFIVSEGAAVSRTRRGWLGAPGLYSDQQVEGDGGAKLWTTPHFRGLFTMTVSLHPHLFMPVR
jgi:2,4-dienoyl-CoA reductase-like NADH-dependent reductase (Old Yellow Enzyme family)